MDIPFREEPETRKGFPCRAFRWTFRVERGFLGFVHQHELEGVWYDSHNAINGVWTRDDYLWGSSHIYWDGPHCAFNLGLITIQWHNPGCRRCWGER